MTIASGCPDPARSKFGPIWYVIDVVQRRPGQGQKLNAARWCRRTRTRLSRMGEVAGGGPSSGRPWSGCCPLARRVAEHHLVVDLQTCNRTPTPDAMKILVVEDDRETASYLVKGLSESGYTVDQAGDGRDGLFLATSGGYDAIVLDRMLPSMDGLAMLGALRGG